ncbi:lysozyme [Caulobacter sp. RHG1]|uniref:lysozyme n=1 Tax=Caulobacter sp. (strain RHG1) TaxID=2545762 RepID=UPI00155236BC|nr:lysozyme [Caulobacter sp. RHG1]NQE62976.1 Phage lysin [Caulobacter sp. RHG1]
MATTKARAVPASALALIKRFEGLHDGDKKTPHILEPEADPIGIWTVGWGYALFENGKPVTNREQAYRIWRKRWPGGLTRLEADLLLTQVAQEVTDKVVRLLAGRTPTDAQLGAMVSLAYNIGVGEIGGKADFADSTVRRKFLAGDLVGAADAFRSWKFAGGKVLQGLVNRREAERAVFLGKA